MPLEPGCVGDRASRPASKNAKDKSNSAALLASRVRAHAEQEANGRESRCSSEKDSGYSDTGSDSIQTDAEDQRSCVTETKAHKPSSTEQDRLKGNHILVSSPSELTPIFIIKNVVLKQPVQSGQEHVLQPPLAWASGGSNTQTPTHVLLLQQPGITAAPLHILKPQPQRSESSGGKKNKNKNTYLPILNSYPRIAPHPSKKTSEKPLASRGSITEEHSLSKRVCTEEKREEVSTSTQVPEKHLHKQLDSHPLLHSHSLMPTLSTTCDTVLNAHQRRSPPRSSSPCTSLSLGSPSVSSSENRSPRSSCKPMAQLLSTRRGTHRHNSDAGSRSDSRPGGSTQPGSARHRRFLNTVEILSQSGLLDITLRTQELLRQSTATERDIAQLRLHTQLLCKAAQAGAHTPSAWEKLHQAMAESGCYPSLKCLLMEANKDGQQGVEADTSSKPDAQVTYRYGLNGNEEVAPPSPLLEPLQGMDSPSDAHQSSANAVVTFPGHGQGHSVNLPEELLMPPDSSTQEGLL